MDLKDIIIVDNSPSAYSLQISNGLPIETWIGNRKDVELSNISQLLIFLSEIDDVRKYIEKIVVNNTICYPIAKNYINEFYKMKEIRSRKENENQDNAKFNKQSKEEIKGKNDTSITQIEQNGLGNNCIGNIGVIDISKPIEVVQNCVNLNGTMKEKLTEKNEKKIHKREVINGNEEHQDIKKYSELTRNWNKKIKALKRSKEEDANNKKFINNTELKGNEAKCENLEDEGENSSINDDSLGINRELKKQKINLFPISSKCKLINIDSEVKNQEYYKKKFTYICVNYKS